MNLINELRRLAQAALAGPDGISLNWVKLLQDFQQKANPATISELLDRLEAAEKENALRERVIDALGSALNAVANKRDDLRAKIAEMERQEPVAVVEDDHNADGLSARISEYLPAGMMLYALHGAQPAPSVPDDWMQHAARMAALARKLREPDWHFESIREMQRELCALEEAALAAAPEAKT